MMSKQNSSIDEQLVHLYLRLNGYFSVGFIVHGAKSNAQRTDVDALAVRFPLHKEPQREINCCDRLVVNTDSIDLIVSEVKGGRGKPCFNSPTKEKDVIKTILDRLGIFEDETIERLSNEIGPKLDNKCIECSADFLQWEEKTSPKIGNTTAKLRFILFATGQLRGNASGGPIIFGDDVLDYVWRCLQHENPRLQCSQKYDYTLWGALQGMVRYFKGRRENFGTIDDLRGHLTAKK